MPRYDYYCPDCGQWFEAWQGVGDFFTPCLSCGTSSKRAACSGLPAIRGETVGSSFSSSRAVDLRGRYRLSDFREASEEIADSHTRAERREGRSLKGPDLYKEGIRKAASMGARVRSK